MVASPDSPFRHQVPELGTGIVTRARLLGELAKRFDRRLVVVVASAGFGKTTVLAQAVFGNELDPMGVDLWLQVTDRDRDPGVLLAGLAGALAQTTPVRVADEPGVDDLIESIWAAAPLDISIVVDDAHVLDGSRSWKILARLCADMPTNGHLVIGTRTLPPLPIRSLQARDEVVIVDETQMAFDDDEVHAFAEVRGLPGEAENDLPVWPALAALASSVGPEASVGFVWESILEGIPAERRRALALLVRFGRIDDALVSSIVGDRWTAARLVDGLPLIESIGNDRRFHDLWAEALVDEADPADWRSALVSGAAILAGRGEPMRAARCLYLAGDEERLVEAARTFAKVSLSSGINSVDAAWFTQTLPQSARLGPLGRYLQLVHTPSYGNHATCDQMSAIATDAYKEGDNELAALAVWRLVQMYGNRVITDLRFDGHLRDILDLDEPYSLAASGLVESHLAELAGDVDKALAAVATFAGLEDEARAASTSSRYVALGFPELVQTSLLDVLGKGAASPVDAQAVWLRGEVDPAAAWAVAQDLPARYVRRRFANVQVPLLGVVAAVALAAGETQAARELSDLAEQALLAAAGGQPKLFLYAGVADALTTLAEEGHDAGVEAFTKLNQDVPVTPWPAWAYIGAMAPVRALIPGTEWLDDVRFGGAVSTAIKAGRIVAELYAGGTGAEANDLPWSQPTVLRAHVPPTMLCELACAAGLERPLVAACVDEIPGFTGLLRACTDHPSLVVREAVAKRLAGEAARPSYDLHIKTLGELSVRRTDDIAVSDRVRGGRVQELLAHLIVDPSPRRSDLAAAMWPDLTAKKAAGNLRITLASLLDLIEPDRIAGTSWFVRSSEGRIELSNDGLTTDIGMLQDHFTAAREAERTGLPTVALDHFKLGLAGYGGLLLPDADIDAVVHDRLRFQSLAYNAACRVAELLLAKGEPEEAMPYATRAEQIDPIAERAYRLEIRCHLALGSRSAARSSGERLRSMLLDEGITPEYETTQLLGQL